MLANLFHNNPARVVRPVAVTGTNGKTTTAYLVRHLLAKGQPQVRDGDRHGGNRRWRYMYQEASMTTPAACDIAALLASMRDKGCRACAIETSSHALDQGRVAGVQFAGAAFTNLTGDHLDYHKTMENYAAAKAEKLLPRSDPLALQP